MDEELQKDLKKQFQALPPEVQKAISSADLPTKLQEIVKNNKLMIDQAGKLETEMTLVLFGIEPLENFTSNLIKNVGLASIQASVVAHDVNESIFKSIRESLKQINDAVATKKETPAETNPIPSKESILAGIEQPEQIKNVENSISISSLKSNSATPDTHESIDKGIQIKINNLPEIAPKAILPMTSSDIKSTEPFHQNISPVANIVEAKMTSTVAVPKETIVIEGKTKLPEKPKASGDPYRESLI